MRTFKSEKGMSLVEASIILMILATLTAVIAPSMGDFLEDSRAVKAKEDVEALGISVKRLLRDTGFTALKFDDGTAAVTLANRADLLESAGSAPTVTPADFTSASNITDDDVNWTSATTTQTATFENQLVRNDLATTDYAVPTTGKRDRGWRGSYVNAPIGADPWGYKYYANTVFLSVATDASAGSGQGQATGYWTKDVIVISAGPDNTIQAPIQGSTNGGSGSSGSDDVIFVIQGATY
jgi:type II secretory pathway pseudopilin PulG